MGLLHDRMQVILLIVELVCHWSDGAVDGIVELMLHGEQTLSLLSLVSPD